VPCGGFIIIWEKYPGKYLSWTIYFGPTHGNKYLGAVQQNYEILVAL
jgi:hypothetical protein